MAPGQQQFVLAAAAVAAQAGPAPQPAPTGFVATDASGQAYAHHYGDAQFVAAASQRAQQLGEPGYEPNEFHYHPQACTTQFDSSSGRLELAPVAHHWAPASDAAQQPPFFANDAPPLVDTIQLLGHDSQLDGNHMIELDQQQQQQRHQSSECAAGQHQFQLVVASGQQGQAHQLGSMPGGAPVHAASYAPPPLYADMSDATSLLGPLDFFEPHQVGQQAGTGNQMDQNENQRQQHLSSAT